jgi:S1-C subfamily serine protease
VLTAGTVVGIAVARGGGSTSGHPVAASRAVPWPAGTSVSTDASRTPSASPVTDFATIYASERSGVVRIDVLGCAESGIGTGFLLSPTLVATVNHVVTDAVVVSLTAGHQHVTGEVIGTDPQRDLALVRADTPIAGYHFRFADVPPRVGDGVAAIGFPIGDPITMTQGAVSGLNRSINATGQRQTGLVETDAAVNPGNSGGPLLTADGRAVGLVDALRLDANGIAYAVPATQAAPEMSRWAQSPRPAMPASCGNPLGPRQTTTVLPPIRALTPETSAGVVAAFERYFDGINTGHYRAAWHVLSPRVRGSFTSFADGDSTSYDFDQHILAARQLDARTARVVLGFTSIQAPDKGPNGEVCDLWTIAYTMIDGPGGAWLIDATAPYQGTWHTTC